MFKKFNAWWPIVAITLIVAIFFYPVWLKGQIPLPADFTVGTYYPWLDYKWAGYNAGVPVKNPITTDVVSFMFPMQIFAIEQMKQGIIPLWNNLILAGTPLLANFQSAPFSPTNFVYFLFDKLTAWSLQIFMQPLLGAIFLYLLLRHFNRSKIAAVAGGILFAFAGFMTIWLQWNGHSLVAAFFPLVILLTSKWLSSGRFIFGLLLSIVLCLQLFSGYPQIIFYEFISLGLLIATTNIKQFLDFKRIIPLAFFVLMGIGLSAVQVVPGLELLLNSQRSIEIIENKWAFLPWELIITFVAPDFFGNHATYNYWGPADYTLTTGFSGVVAVILSVLGFLIYFKEKNVKFAISLILFALIIAFPNPLSVALKESGVLGSQAASNHRVLILSNLGFAILAAFGIDALILSRVRLKEIIRASYIPLILISSFGIGTIVSWRSFNLSHFEIGLRNLVLPGAFLAAATLILILSLIFKKYKFIFVILLVGLSIIELFRFGWKFTPFSPKDFVYPSTPVLEFLSSQEKPFRVAAENVVPINMMMPYNIETIEGYDALYPLTLSRYLSALNSGRPDTDAMGRYGSVFSANSTLLDLANVKYLLVLKKDKDGKPTPEGQIPERFKLDKLKVIFEDKSVVVLENAASLPRAFVVTEWKTITGEQEALKTLLDKSSNLSKQVILERDFNQFPQSKDNASAVKYLKLKPDLYELEVDTKSPGLLFLSDNFYPGWKSEVNGQDREVLRANYTFRAVPVDQGSNIVRIYYEPDSFKIGKMISLGSAFVLVLILAMKSLLKIKRR